MWRLFLCLLLVPLVAFGTGDAPTILVVGDSLSAGYGIDPRKGWVELLQQRLQSENYPHRVVNASISGDTTLGGLERLRSAIERHHPRIVILELGGNDGLRAIALGEIRANLEAMIRLSRNASAQVLLVGIRLPPNYGKRYTEGFHAIYQSLARKHSVALVPFLLDGVATRPGMMQPDGIHPTEAAQPRLVDNVWPHLLPLLDRQAER
ncbi:MAG: esterase TesA [Gammaproteobacteria bacterium]